MARRKSKRNSSESPAFRKTYTTDDGKASVTICVDKNSNVRINAFLAAILASRGIRPANAINVTDPYVKRLRKRLFAALPTNVAMQRALQSVRDHHTNTENRLALYIPFAVMLEQSFPLVNGNVLLPENVEIEAPSESYFTTELKENEDELLPTFPAFDNELERRLYYTIAFMDDNPTLWTRLTDDLEKHQEQIEAVTAEEPETDDAGFPPAGLDSSL